MSIEDIVYEKLKTPYGDNNMVKPIELSSQQAKITIPTVEMEDNQTINMWLAEVSRHINDMEQTRENHAFRHLYSCRKWIGGIIVFCKRIIRKLLKWYIEPICFQQTAFNNAVTPSIGRLTESVAYLSQKESQTLEKLQKLTAENTAAGIKLEKRMNEVLQRIAEENTAAGIKLEKRTNEALQRIAEENTAAGIKLEKRTNEVLQRIAEENTAAGIKLEKRTNEVLQRITEENTSASRTLEAHTDERIRQLTEENISLHESIQEMNTAIEELKSMLMLNQNSVEVLERDMECVRDMDTSIFDSSKKSFFDKVTTAQSGEDSIIAYVLMVLGVRPEDITYLDLGANHARELSNTYYFYQQGASGVLVEANPDLIPELKLMRSRDIILNSCVSDHDDDVVNFFIVNGDGLSTSNFEAINNAMTINKNLKIAKTEKIRTITIQSILNNYVQKPPTILNIDIEGEEMNVLQNYDFEHYRPTVICVEMIPYETSLVIDKKNSAVTDYLCGMGYTEYAFTGINSIFVDRNILKGCESA